MGDKVCLKVCPVKEVGKFNLRGKLSPKYIGPYEIIEKLNPAAYRLYLPIELEQVHNVFHISQLKKYILDPNHIIIAEPVEIVENLMYEECPIQILEYRVKKLRNKSIPLVKVLWTNHNSIEAAWETDEDIRSKYPNLFEVRTTFFQAASFGNETYFKGGRV